MDQGIIRPTKAFYRESIVRKYINAMEKDEQPPNITILDAMKILAGTWRRVSTQTIQNCFRKAGIGIEAQQSAIHEEMDSMRANFPELLSEGVTADDIISTDHNLLNLRHQDILAEFRTDNIDQDDGNKELEVLEDCPKRPTVTEVRQAIDTLGTCSLFV